MGAPGGVVRCVECQTDPLTPGHYCECCGRKLSVQEKALETAPITVEAGRGHRAASVARCGSCGGPSADGEGDLCRSCLKAFGTLLGSTTLTSPGGDSVTAGEVAPLEASPSTEVMSSSLSSDVPDAAPPVEIKLPRPVVPEMAPASNGRSETAKAEPAKSKNVHPAKAAKPAVASGRPIVSVPSHRRTRWIVLAAVAVVMVAAIGVPQAARWLGIERPPQTAREGQPEQPTPVAQRVTVAKRRATPRGTPSTAETTTKRRESTPGPPQAAASARPKPTTSARPLGDQPTASARQVTSVFAPSPATEARAPGVAPPPPTPVAAEPRRSIAREAPIGRFFEPTDVDESPQVATRVEPQLPGDLPVRPLNDIVVVRVLVSQTGHPFRVNLLRRSKVGRSMDDAVVTAVTQWTFSPARKRGEAVSCWYNIGVALGRAD
jgi:hypothetical protein